MNILPLSDESLQEAIRILSAGGVIAHATETCYGLACDLSNIDAVKKLFTIKQRPGTQPVSALFVSIEQAKEYVEWNERAEELATQYLPGPLTIILPMRADAPSVLHPSLEHPTTLGCRVSSSPIAQSLAISFNSPLSTTSANLHGQPNPYSAQDIAQQFQDQKIQPDLILDSGTLPQNPPSTVMDLSGKEAQIRRQGNI